MERRKEARFPIHLPVEYQILGLDASPMEAHIRDVSEGGLRLATDAALIPGTFLRIKLQDSVIYAEVKYSCPWLGGYVSGVLVEQVLLGSSELSRLISATWHDVPHHSAVVAFPD